MNSIVIDSEQGLGQALKKRRRALGLTQKQVAKYCQLSNNGLSQIELGKQSIRLNTLLKISKILGFALTLTMEDL